MKTGTFIMGCALALLACTFAGCDDRLEVRQAYDFSLSSWYLQEGIAPDETVEIRLTLDREGGLPGGPLPHRIHTAGG